LEEQVQETATALAASTVEMMSTLTQLVSGTAETAAAVTETATAIEEVKQTAFAAHQKAQEMAGAGQAAVQVSQTGERAVAEAANGLNRIREQMDVVTQRVVKLGEQSEAIGAIISTVTDLAEQSNLLAINAAIEAAKAGAHGKGFTVVAQEVKRLAEQSKRATAQVRTILGEIQQASMSAVRVTEQGTKSVEAGVSQAMDAGGSIRTLAKSILDASQALTQVAAFGQQQLVGMDQVSQAINTIKTASTQNASGMRQIEGALQKLDHVGRSLKVLIEEYTNTRTNGTQPMVSG
jgi:methyl-accepting chemotaxis protein